MFRKMTRFLTLFVLIAAGAASVNYAVDIDGGATPQAGAFFCDANDPGCGS